MSLLESIGEGLVLNAADPLPKQRTADRSKKVAAEIAFFSTDAFESASMTATTGPAAVAAKETAEAVGLVYVSDVEPGIRRKRSGRGFRYETRQGAKLEDAETLKRIRALAIPPAWTEVWICQKPNGHLQATGRDSRGRKQYRYHPRFRDVRESTKYHHMLAFAETLPAIRAKVRKHLALHQLTREKILATLVDLLEVTLIRVGSDEYARSNKSYGLTTLKTRHVKVDGSALRLNFVGKSGRIWNISVTDRRLSKVIRACQDLPGQELFQYVDDDGAIRNITSSDVNDYLREVCERDITAKDFRTWHGTVLAAMALTELQKAASQTAAKRNIRDAIQKVAARLGNTPAICRRCYVHPEILGAYIEGCLMLEVEEVARKGLPSLQSEELAVLKFLRSRLAPALKDGSRASLAA